MSPWQKTETSFPAELEFELILIVTIVLTPPRIPPVKCIVCLVQIHFGLPNKTLIKAKASFSRSSCSWAPFLAPQRSNKLEH